MALQNPILTVPNMDVEFGSEWFEFDGLREPPQHLQTDFGIKRGGWEVVFEGQAKQTTLKVEKGVVRIKGSLNEGYAILLQLLRQRPGHLPKATVSTQWTFTFRCFHLDIARGGVPTLNTFKRFVRWLFLLGYNAFAIYFEDLYPWRTHPDIGVHRGRLTQEEWGELYTYAAQYGVDVFPSLELLGHMENILTLPAYYKFKEMWWSPTDGSLNASSQEARSFAYELLEDVLETSPSKYVLVGGDETWSLGRGRSLDRSGWVFRGPELYLEHYGEIIRRVKAHGKVPIVWGDMLTGVYLEPAEREVWRRVIEDRLWDESIIANWDYSPEDEEHFEKMIDLVGRYNRQIACPGISNWNRLYPNFDYALKNLQNFMAAARKKRLMGFAITAWGDDGSECLFSFLDPLILAGVEAAESGSPAGWREKWVRLTGEPEEVVEARVFFGRKDVADNLKAALYRHGERGVWSHLQETGVKVLGAGVVPESVARANLPEDLSFIKGCVRLASKPDSERRVSDYIGLANAYARLWLSERKPQGLARVLTRLWGSAAAVELGTPNTH